MINNITEIPEELLRANEEVTLSVDNLFSNGMPFLTAMSYDPYFRTAALLASAKFFDISKRANEVFHSCRESSF